MTLEERVAKLEADAKVMKIHLGNLHVDSLKCKSEAAELAAKSAKDDYESTIKAIRDGVYCNY